MAIETTRGLPSFSEMYSAFKNRGSLADVINSGTSGYFTGKEEASKQNLQSAQAQEARAKANKPSEERVPLAALPDEIRGALAPYVDAQGTVSKSSALVALGTTKQGSDANKAAEELKHREEALAEKTKHDSEMAAVQQQLADLRASLGQSGQELGAAQTIANTNKDASPSLVQSLVGKIGEVTNIPAIIPDEYTRAKQFTAATQKLNERARIPAADQGVIPPTSDMIAPKEAHIPPVVPKRAVVITNDNNGAVTYDKLPDGAQYMFNNQIYTKGQK